jgi:autotransporter strand-loop-strand O-heptosyltransferase
MKIAAHSYFGYTGGIAQHAENFFKALESHFEVVRVNLGEPIVHDHADVRIILCGVQEFAHQMKSIPTSGRKIAFIAWESTRYPDHFVRALKGVDELWVPSQWQRIHSITQLVPLGYSPDFIRVVPEGVNVAEFYPPTSLIFDYKTSSSGRASMRFMIFGRWEDRKSTKEMISGWLEEFKTEKNVELILSVDNAFPVDKYTTTEERLSAYGFNDKRIKVIHFPPKTEYVKYLQGGHVLLNVSRSEGWGLPIIEGMTCGIPVVTTDWSGNTEFCDGACKVPVDKLIKPFNVYGVEDCPGQWAEPKWDSYKWWLRELYQHYDKYREAALKQSKIIAKDFSWEQAALKAVKWLESVPKAPESKIVASIEEPAGEGGYSQVRITSGLPEVITPNISEAEAAVRLFARKHGFDLPVVERIKAAFVIGCWPNASDKMNTLIETITQVRAYGFPVIISTHYALPAPVLELADFVIYEKENILSGDWTPTYNRRLPDGTEELKQSRIQYHGVAVMTAIRNAVDFCRGRFSQIHYLEYDSEVDLGKFLDQAWEKPFTGIRYEDKSDGIRTDVWSAAVEFLDKNIPRIESWDHYMSKGYSYVLEYWLWNYWKDGGVINDCRLISFPVHNRFDQVDRDVWDNDVFNCNFVDGPQVDIGGISNREYDVAYSSPDKGVVYSVKQKTGMWSRPNVRYYKDWTIAVGLNGKEMFRHTLDLKGKKVLIPMGSKALGDTIAWFPYLEEFQKKHDCKVVSATWWNEILDYPEIEVVVPGSRVDDLYASYEVGCFDNDLTKNVSNWRTVPMQKIASDILGLEYKPLKPKLKRFPNTTVMTKKPYVCFSEHSTMQAKYWNYEGGWQIIIDYLKSIGYDVVSVSKESTNLENCIKHNGVAIEQTMGALSGAEFYIGLGHGVSWLAWALNVPVILISGFSEEWEEFYTPHRIINKSVCHGCFNDLSVEFDRGMDWCPHKKHFECTRSITPKMVIKEIDKLAGRSITPKKGRRAAK